MEQRGFAVAGFRDGDEWRCEALPPAVLADLGVLISALRSQVSGDHVPYLGPHLSGVGRGRVWPAVARRASGRGVARL